MKLTYKTIPSFLKDPTATSASVLIYGPDGGQTREHAKNISTLLLGENSDPMNHIELSEAILKEDPARLHDELSAMSLIGGPRVVVLRNAGDKMAAIIEECFTTIDTETYLIVTADELSPRSPLRKLYESTKNFAALPCYRDEGFSLKNVIKESLSEHGITATPAVLTHLEANLGNDRAVTRQECEKIALYLGDETTLDETTARLLIGANDDITLDTLCHAVAGGDLYTCQTTLTRLIRSGEQPVGIIRVMLRFFQRLQLARGHMQSGLSTEEAIKQLRPPVFFKFVNQMSRHVSRWSPKKLASALQLLLKTEKEIKSTGAQPEQLVSHALLRLTKAA